MSELIEAKDGQVYTGYNLAGSQFCIAVGNIISFCYTANLENGKVVLEILASSQFRILKKVEIVQNTSFSWDIGLFKLTNTITNFSNNAGHYSFDGHFKIESGYKWLNKTGSHHFENNVQLLKSYGELSDAEFTNMLVLHSLLNQEK
jgi:hypothetical protein